MGRAKENPYVGPRAFGNEDSHLFYGREQETRHLTSLIIAQRVVLLYAPSGAGKTSLINASLVPRLKRRDRIEVLPPGRVGSSLPPEGDEAEVQNRYVLSVLLGLVGEDVAPGELVGMSLCEGFGRHLASVSDSERRRPRLLVLDQFEELFTATPRRHEERAEFFRQLQACLVEYPQLSLLISMREDYVARLDPFAALMPDRLRTRFRLDLLGTEAALEAVQRPALQAGVEFSDAAALKLVDDLRIVRVQRPDGTTEELPGQTVEPVQLQVVCRRLWDQLSSEATQIVEQDLEAVGDVDRALADYYGERAIAVADQTGVSERAIRDWVDEHLITEQGIRGQVLQGPERSDGLENQVIWLLVDAHLVRAEVRRGATWFELAHDRLIEPVRADNERWRRDCLAMLQRQAALWDDEDRPEGLLLRDQALADAEAWAQAHEDELTGVDRMFLQESQEAQAVVERERRQNFRIRWLAVGATALAVVAIVLAVMALRTRNVAVRQQCLAEARALVAQGQSTKDHELSVLLGVEAVQRPCLGRSGIAASEAINGLNQAVARSRWRATLKGHRARIWHAAWDSEGTRIVTASADKSAKVWDAMTGATLLTLGGHTGEVRHVAWSNDNARILTASEDGTARVWDAATGQVLLILSHQTDPPLKVFHAAWSPDDRYVVTASADGSARVWDADTGELRHTLASPGGWVYHAAWDSAGSRIVTASSNRIAKVWDAASGDEIAVLEGHSRDVLYAAWSPDDTGLVTTGYGGEAIVWEWDEQESEWQERSILLGHRGPIYHAAWDSSGTRIVTASDDGTAKVWRWEEDSSAWQELFTLHGHTWNVRYAAWSGDGTRLLTASADGDCKVWDARTGHERFTLSGHTDWVYQAAWSPDDSRIVTAGNDSLAKVWNAQIGGPFVLAGHTGPVGDAAWSSDGARIVTGSWDKTARVWDSQTGATIHVLVGHEERIQSVSWDSEDARILTASCDDTARVWRAATGEELLTLIGHTGCVNRAAWSPDEARIVTASDDGTARVWDATRGTELLVLGGHTRVRDAAWNSEGTRIVTAGQEGTARVWDVGLGSEQPVIAFTEHISPVYRALWSPDDRRIVTVSEDGTARVWDANTGEETVTLEGHTGLVWFAVWSADGSRILTSSEDGTARVWDVRRGKELLRLVGHGKWVNRALWSPDETRILTASDDTTVKVWDANTGDDLVTFTRHTDEVWHAAWSPDGTRALSTGKDGGVYVNITSTDDLVDIACDRTGRNLTKQEWLQYIGRDEPYRDTCPGLPGGE